MSLRDVVLVTVLLHKLYNRSTKLGVCRPSDAQNFNLSRGILFLSSYKYVHLSSSNRRQKYDFRPKDAKKAFKVLTLKASYLAERKRFELLDSLTHHTISRSANGFLGRFNPFQVLFNSFISTSNDFLLFTVGLS